MQQLSYPRGYASAGFYHCVESQASVVSVDPLSSPNPWDLCWELAVQQTYDHTMTPFRHDAG
jgi:hypothetical protein